MNNDRITALEQQLAVIQAEIEKLKAEEEHKEVKPWRAEYSSKYYYVSDGGVIDCHLDDYDECDNILHSRGNYYRTEALAEQDAKELALRGRVRQLRDALCEGYRFVPSGNNFYVYFDVLEKYYFVSIGSFNCVVGTVYFDTKEHAQTACDILNAEMRKESGGNG